MSPFAPIQGTALTGLDRPSGAVVLVEVWTEAGETGLAALAAPSGLGPAVTACRAALAPRAAEPAASAWLEASLEWAAWGAVQAARADLAARVAGVPLWLWLGGKVSASASASALAQAHPSEDRIAGAPEGGWPALERRVLDRSIDVIRVGPVAVGGPEGVRRLDAIARAWQLELTLVAETPLLVSRALAAHLALTMTTATMAPPRSDAMSVPWLRSVDDAPGLGVTLDRDALAATGAERIVVA